MMETLERLSAGAGGDSGQAAVIVLESPPLPPPTELPPTQLQLGDVVQVSESFLAAGPRRGCVGLVQRVYGQRSCDVAFPGSAVLRLVPMDHLRHTCLADNVSDSEAAWFGTTLDSLLESPAEACREVEDSTPLARSDFACEKGGAADGGPCNDKGTGAIGSESIE